MEKNIELVSQDNDLKCDNPNCDYVIRVRISDLGQWINKPCPKCSENLLTYEDFKRVESALQTAEFINSLTPEQIEELNKAAKESGLLEEFEKSEIGQEVKKITDEDPTAKVRMFVETHKDVKITSVKKMD
jgi:hypothetical protein